MKYIISFIVISALSFMNIGNCFAGSAEGNGSLSEYVIIAAIVFLVFGVGLWKCTKPSKKRKENSRELEYANSFNYDQNIVNQLGRNYLNSNEAKRLIEDVVRGYLKKEGKALLEPSVSKKISENKDAPSLQPTTIKEQSQFVNTQTVNQGYTEKDSKDASMQSASAKQQDVALEQAAMTETHSEASDRLTIKYARETNNSFTLRDIKDTYQKGKSLYKLTIYSDNITARIEPLLERDEVKQRALNDEGKLLEPICEIEKASDKPKDIKLISSGSAKLEDGNWVVDDKHKIRIKFE
ncbi:MAG: hypothetical protein MR448_06265 [Parabacteroides sp.]|nr:hypothetical protein [Parabacteroides sp.]